VEVLEAIETAYQGTVVAQTHRDNQVADVAVILDEKNRQDPEAIGSLLLRSHPRRPPAPARTRRDLSHQRTPLHPPRRRAPPPDGDLRRQWTRRHLVCRGSEKAGQGQVSFPAGAYAVFSGVAQAKERAQRELLLHSAIAVVGILLLLTIVFHNWRNLLLLLVNVPFALVGGVLAVWLSGLLQSGESSLTIGSLVGFVTLFGITMRNSIMMISHFEHLVTEEGMTWGPEAAIRGASERLMPILMTATVIRLRCCRWPSAPAKPAARSKAPWPS